MKKKNSGNRIWMWTKRIFLFIFLFQLFYIIILKWVNPPFTLTQLGSLFSGHGIKRDYVDYDEMSYNIKLAVIASEDQKFATHSGFDWISIDRAIKHNEKKPKKVRGASSISQQVAKNVFLWQGRSWIRKGLEVYFTKMIEWIWGKKRILEVYLNVIEMGKGIYGVQAASKKYFNKNAIKLTRREAALIAGCLPNPIKYTVKPVSPFVAYKSAWILIQMRNVEANPDIKKLISTKPEPAKKRKKKKKIRS